MAQSLRLPDPHHSDFHLDVELPLRKADAHHTDSNLTHPGAVEDETLVIGDIQEGDNDLRGLSEANTGEDKSEVRRRHPQFGTQGTDDSFRSVIVQQTMSGNRSQNTADSVPTIPLTLSSAWPSNIEMRGGTIVAHSSIVSSALDRYKSDKTTDYEKGLRSDPGRFTKRSKTLPRNQSQFQATFGLRYV